MQRRLTTPARRGLIGGIIVVAGASAISFNGGTVRYGIGMTVACLVAVILAVAFVQYLTAGENEPRPPEV